VRRRRLVILLVLSVIVVGAVAWVGENVYAARWIATNCRNSGQEGAPPAGARDVEFANGLHAWWTPPTQAGRATIVMVHGYPGDRRDFAQFASAIQGRGYGTFRVALACAHMGALYGGGSREAEEVVAAARQVHQLGPGPVALFGFSGGGTAAVLAADRGAPVVAVVTDSAPTNLINITHYMTFPRWFYQLTPLVYPLVSHGGRLVDLQGGLRRSYAVPTLVIQGEADTYVNPHNGPRLAALTHGQLWMVPGADHGKSFTLEPQAYTDRVAGFLASVRV